MGPESYCFGATETHLFLASGLGRDDVCCVSPPVSYFLSQISCSWFKPSINIRSIRVYRTVRHHSVSLLLRILIIPFLPVRLNTNHFGGCMNFQRVDFFFFCICFLSGVKFDTPKKIPLTISAGLQTTKLTIVLNLNSYSNFVGTVGDTEGHIK